MLALKKGMDELMQEAYAGIDVAFAKNKRLPVAVVVRLGAGLEPLV